MENKLHQIFCKIIKEKQFPYIQTLCGYVSKLSRDEQREFKTKYKNLTTFFSHFSEKYQIVDERVRLKTFIPISDCVNLQQVEGTVISLKNTTGIIQLMSPTIAVVYFKVHNIQRLKSYPYSTKETYDVQLGDILLFDAVRAQKNDHFNFTATNIYPLIYPTEFPEEFESCDGKICRLFQTYGFIKQDTIDKAILVYFDHTALSETYQNPREDFEKVFKLNETVKFKACVTRHGDHVRCIAYTVTKIESNSIDSKKGFQPKFVIPKEDIISSDSEDDTEHFASEKLFISLMRFKKKKGVGVQINDKLGEIYFEDDFITLFHIDIVYKNGVKVSKFDESFFQSDIYFNCIYDPYLKAAYKATLVWVGEEPKQDKYLNNFHNWDTFKALYKEGLEASESQNIPMVLQNEDTQIPRKSSLSLNSNVSSFESEENNVSDSSYNISHESTGSNVISSKCSSDSISSSPSVNLEVNSIDNSEHPLNQNSISAVQNSNLNPPSSVNVLSQVSVQPCAKSKVIICPKQMAIVIDSFPQFLHVRYIQAEYKLCFNINADQFLVQNKTSDFDLSKLVGPKDIVHFNALVIADALGTYQLYVASASLNKICIEAIPPEELLKEIPKYIYLEEYKHRFAVKIPLSFKTSLNNCPHQTFLNKNYAPLEADSERRYLQEKAKSLLQDLQYENTALQSTEQEEMKMDTYSQKSDQFESQEPMNSIKIDTSEIYAQLQTHSLKLNDCEEKINAVVNQLPQFAKKETKEEVVDHLFDLLAQKDPAILLNVIKEVLNRHDRVQTEEKSTQTILKGI